MKMVSMKSESKKVKGSEKSKAHTLGAPSLADSPSPPDLHFSHEHIKKLGMKTLPAVGDKLHIQAIAHVASTSAHTGSDGKPNHHMTLELHHVGYEHHAESEQEKQANAQKGGKAAIDDALGDLGTSDEE